MSAGPDWLDRLYADDDPKPGPDPAAPDTDELALRDRLRTALHRRSGPPDPPPGTVTISVPAQPDAEPRWHQGPQPADQPQQPGVHVTVIPEAPAQTSRWRAVVRRWIAFHAAAAAAGWALGLTGAITDFLASAGDGGVPAGIGLIVITGFFGYWLPQLRVVPAPLRPAVLWVCRIPPATTLLALALYTPHALIGATP